nr:uncharacterized protein LOC128670906 [Plodia interpunctella]
MIHIAFVSPIEVLLQTIINQYLGISYCLTVVAETPINCMYPVSFTYIVPNDNLTGQMLDVSEKGCSDYIVRVREPNLFMVSFDEVNQLGNTRRSNRKIVFLPAENDEYDTNKLLDILSLKQTSFVPHLLMIVPSANISGDECQSYDLVTHNYVGSDDESSQLVNLDQWNSCTDKFHGNVNLFPHDMSNLYGKTFKIACFTYKPYTLLDIDSIEHEITGRDGTEMRVMDEFCKWVNCTVKIIRDDDHEWGEIYENRTGVGILGHVVEDRADAGISALYSWYEEYVQLDFSIPTVRTAITCVAPSPRLLASWEMPLMPFNLNMWIALIFTFIFACICLTIAKRCSSDRVGLTTFGMLITQSQPESAVGTTWRIRSVTAWLLISGLVLDNAYGGGLASVFTVPKYEPSIDTVQDLVDRGMQWGATHDAWIFSITNSHDPLIKQLVSLFRVMTAEDLKEKSFTRKLAYSIEKLPAGNFAIGDYITQEALIDLTVMQEDFYYEQSVVMLRKSSPYTEKISQFLGRLHASGLILAWETQVVLKHMNFEVQLEVRYSRARKEVEAFEPLNFRHVVGVFFIYALGVLISVALFFMEIVWNRTVKVAAFSYEPYIILDIDEAIEPIGRDGTEVRLVDEFCRWLNCAVEIIRNEDEHQWGEIYPNRTGVGILGNLVADRADIGIASLFYWYEEYVYLDFTTTTIRSAVTCVAPSPSITAWLLISGLVIDNAYGGGLASVFTVPTYEPSIDTVQDLVDRGMEWGATEDAWVYSLNTSTDPFVKQLVSLFRVKSAEELKELSFTRKMAYPFEKLPGGNYAIRKYITKEALVHLSTMTEDFYYAYCVIMLRKSSPYTEKLNQLIGRLQESGLLLAWENQVALKYMNYEVQLQVRLSRLRKDGDTVEPLHFRQLVGVFFIYALGVLISVALFFMEIIWNKKLIKNYFY